MIAPSRWLGWCVTYLYSMYRAEALKKDSLDTLLTQWSIDVFCVYLGQTHPILIVADLRRTIFPPSVAIGW